MWTIGTISRTYSMANWSRCSHTISFGERGGMEQRGGSLLYSLPRLSEILPHRISTHKTYGSELIPGGIEVLMLPFFSSAQIMRNAFFLPVSVRTASKVSQKGVALKARSWLAWPVINPHGSHGFLLASALIAMCLDSRWTASKEDPESH